MTPLAYRLAKQLTLPVKRRTFIDEPGLLDRFDDIHCFEVTEVHEIAQELIEHINKTGNVDARTSFLPAPKTWIEFYIAEDGVAGRVGYLLEEREGGRAAIVTMAIEARDSIGGTFYAVDAGRLDLGTSAQRAFGGDVRAFAAEEGDDPAMNGNMLLAHLALINTPRIIGRRQHMPHKGLERALVRSRGMVGKFPLHAWTEIKLEVTAPKDLSDRASVEAHLTGGKALHFCRAHLRVRLGRLEVVRSHWRGDPALGIKQSRYKLAS